MRKSHHSILAAAALLAACGGTASALDGSESALRAPRFVDAVDYLSAEGNGALDRFVELRQALRSGFDDACSDTFCEGDYSDLQPLELRCSVEARDGAIQACAWSLAGSIGKVAASTGNLRVSGKVYVCRLPASGNIDGMIGALLAPGDVPLLRRPLPGSASSIFAALGDCNLGH